MRGERLIERQILQLKEAGIEDITIVLGYKKDMFAYLEDKYGVRLLFNPAYNIKNNIESLRVARSHIRNSYICVCDNYFAENPFHRYEYRSFYAGYSSSDPEDEFTAHIGPDGRIQLATVVFSKVAAKLKYDRKRERHPSPRVPFRYIKRT